LGNMSLLLLILIQAQEPPRLSKAVIAGAVLVFLVGLSMLVYFFRRYKSTEKEAQDEWDRPEQSLFGAVMPSVDQTETRSTTEAEGAIATAEPDPERSEPGDEAPMAPLTLDSQPATEMRPATQELKSDQSLNLAPAPITEIPRRPTEVLSSTALEPETLSNEAKPQSSPVDVEASDKVPASTELLGVEDTLAASSEQQAEVPASTTAEPEKPRSQTELLGAARVDARPPREPFEPPSITPIVHREPWETPHIEPLKPRAQPSVPLPERIEASTQMLASPPVVAQPAASGADASSAETQHPVVARAGAGRASMRVPSGSVLGLPAERSDAPLVFGKPTRPKDEIGIGDFSNPWKGVDSGGGHGGTIALAGVILLLGGAIAAYLLVPSVSTRVNAMVARARGIDPNPPPPIEQPKARVFPARNEANKNLVKARGAVDNISEETLSNLSVEVSLERGNGAPPEVRKVAVNPAQLTPKQRGVFEFEYDGNRATGFSGYRIVRLVSGEGEIKFTTPGRTG
jgi:membrane protein implicated in regulation of membrane protease activity